jgi:paraquat-inducible protein B
VSDPGADPPARPPAAAIRTRSRRRLSLIWLIPIATVLIAIYLAVDTIASRGPTVTLTFQTAEGLTAGKSVVKEKDVEMGTVRSITVSDDNKHVVLTLDMKPEAKRLINDGTQFWVVKARFFAGAVSGLETLLSGAYVEMRADQVGDSGKRDFTGLEEPPLLESNVPGRTLLVHADRLGSISLGSPVFFRDIAVGQVLGYDIGDMAREITMHVFVRDPFDKYVHDNSRFWNASGISASLTGNGLQLQVQSLRAVLLGGIAFDTPDGGRPLAAGEDAGKFSLFKDHEAAVASTYGRQLRFVSYFGGSVRGLSVGADVELRGIKIGQVTDVQLRYDAKADQVTVPVSYTVQPDRIAANNVGGDIDAYVGDLIRRGLRAQLSSGNLITGAQLVSLDIVPDAPPAEIGHEGDVIVVPTLKSGGFENITRSASDILAKVDAIPFDQIGQHLNNVMAGADAAAGGQQLKQAVTSLNETLANARDVTGKLDQGLKPTLDRLPQIAGELQQAVAQANKVLASVATGYGGDSRFHEDLSRTLSQLSDTARSIKALADLLSRHPEALIRGRTDRGVE